jgi:hypothetical protein
MRIIQSLTKQDVMSFHRTLLDAMKSSMADEAMPGTEEQICVIRRETRESIEHKTVDSNIDGIGEDRTLIEQNPVGVMVVGHGLLNYSDVFH